MLRPLKTRCTVAVTSTPVSRALGKSGRLISLTPPAGLVNKTVGLVLERIGQQCETQLTPDNLRKVVSDDICQKYGPELFGVLCGLTGGDADGVVRGILAKHQMRCGFAAYFMLNVRFNPKTPGRMLQFLLTVTNTPSVKDVRLIPRAIEDWEAKKAG